MEFVRRIKAGLNGIPTLVKRTKRGGRSFLGKAFVNSDAIGMPSSMRDDGSEDESDSEEEEAEASEMKEEKEESKVGSKRGREAEDDKENLPTHNQRLVIDERIGSSKQKLQEQLAKRRSLSSSSSSSSSSAAPRADRRFETDRALAGVVEFSLDDIMEGDAEAGAAAGSAPAARLPVVTDDSAEERAQMQEFLFSKIRHNHLDVVSKCISGGRHDMFALDERGNTALHISAQNNLKPMAALLLREAGFGHDGWLNRRNHKGMTALDYAEMYKFTKLAEWLVLKGAGSGEGAAQGKRGQGHVDRK